MSAVLEELDRRIREANERLEDLLERERLSDDFEDYFEFADAKTQLREYLAGLHEQRNRLAHGGAA